MNSKTTLTITAALLVLALTMAGAWYHTYQALQASRLQLVVSTLEPAAALLKENQALIAELQSDTYAEKDNGILESYLIKIRRDGVAKAAPMKQRLDQLAENNTALVILVAAYEPNAKTPGFALEANKFRNYVAAWRDRWNSVLELFMAGGNYPAAGAVFPRDFPSAVQAEIAAAK